MKATDFDLLLLDRIEQLQKKIRFREKIPLIGGLLTTRLRLDTVELVERLSDGGIRKLVRCSQSA